MAEANIQAILGNRVEPPNPLQILSGWQDYANKVQQNKLSKANTANVETDTAARQQALALAKVQRANQVAFGLWNDPEISREKVASAIQQEVAMGTIDKQRADQAVANLPADPGQLKQAIAAHIMSNLSVAQQIQSNVPQVQDTNIGGQIVPRTTGSPAQMMMNPGLGISTSPGAIARTQSPEQANQIETVIGPDNQPRIGRNYQFGGVNGAAGAYQGPSSVPPALQNPANAAQRGGGAAPVQQPPQAGGPGMLSAGPVTANKQEGSNLDLNNADFQTVRKAAVPLANAETNLLRAQDLLNKVVTGPATDKVQAVQNFISSVSGILGVPVNANDIAAGNYDELTKTLSQIASQGGSNSRLASELGAVLAGNPNMLYNRLANSDIISNMVGVNRQQQAIIKLTTSPTGADLPEAQKRAAELDPRALALDVMTPQSKKKVVDDVAKMTADAQRKFYHSVELAQRLGLWTYSAPTAAK